MSPTFKQAAPVPTVEPWAAETAVLSSVPLVGSVNNDWTVTTFHLGRGQSYISVRRGCAVCFCLGSLVLQFHLHGSTLCSDFSLTGMDFRLNR